MQFFDEYGQRLVSLYPADQERYDGAVSLLEAAQQVPLDVAAAGDTPIDDEAADRALREDDMLAGDRAHHQLLMRQYGPASEATIACVQYAARVLDEVLTPGWWNLIDVNQLDIESPKRCVIVQAYGDFAAVMDVVLDNELWQAGENSPDANLRLLPTVFYSNIHLPAWVEELLARQQRGE